MTIRQLATHQHDILQTRHFAIMTFMNLQIGNFQIAATCQSDSIKFANMTIRQHDISPIMITISRHHDNIIMAS
jgi:hypothetical protein